MDVVQAARLGPSTPWRGWMWFNRGWTLTIPPCGGDGWMWFKRPDFDHSTLWRGWMDVVQTGLDFDHSTLWRGMDGCGSTEARLGPSTPRTGVDGWFSRSWAGRRWVCRKLAGDVSLGHVGG